MTHVPFSAKKPLLFCRRNQEEYGAARTLGGRQFRKSFCDLNYACDTGSVVNSAIVDGVAATVRLTNAKMIPVRRINNVLVLQTRIASRQSCHDVVRFYAFDFAVERNLAVQIQLHRMKIARCCLLSKLIQILTG